MNDVVVSIESLTRQYRDADHPAISQLTLQINRGSLFGLLGPNGAGKTTLVTMLCGLMKPDAGTIQVMGMDATKNSQSVRKKIGVATQEIALFPTLTAYENLFYFGKMYGLESAILKTRIENYLRIFALTAKARKKVQTFSGGMKRRLNLIAALLHEPSLLILDEPTSGVDVQSRGIILDFMQQMRSTGTTIIYSSHYLEEAEKICTHIAILNEGKLIATGTPVSLKEAHQGSATLEDLFLHLTGKHMRD